MNSDTAKIAGYGALAVMFCVALALTPDKPETWGGVLGLFSMVAGGGSAIKGAVKYALRLP
jgi:hypothetical protein